LGDAEDVVVAALGQDGLGCGGEWCIGFGIGFVGRGGVVVVCAGWILGIAFSVAVVIIIIMLLFWFWTL